MTFGLMSITAVKSPHDIGICQKAVGNSVGSLLCSAGDFHAGSERKTLMFWIQMAIKSPTFSCKG